MSEAAQSFNMLDNVAANAGLSSPSRATGGGGDGGGEAGVFSDIFSAADLAGDAASRARGIGPNAEAGGIAPGGEGEAGAAIARGFLPVSPLASAFEGGGEITPEHDAIVAPGSEEMPGELAVDAERADQALAVRGEEGAGESAPAAAAPGGDGEAAAAPASLVDPAIQASASAGRNPGRAGPGGDASGQAGPGGKLPGHGEGEIAAGAKGERTPSPGDSDEAELVAARRRAASATGAESRLEHSARPTGGEIGERPGAPSALFQANSEPPVFASPTETAQSVVRAALQPDGAALPMRAIAVHMAQRLADGVREFQIRLDPPELGRIDIRIEIARDGHLTAQLTTDRPETLDALQRDARALERALQNAGLDLAEGALNFNLRGEGAGGDGDDAASRDGEGDDADSAPASRRAIRLDGLDITV